MAKSTSKQVIHRRIPVLRAVAGWYRDLGLPNKIGIWLAIGSIACGVFACYVAWPQIKHWRGERAMALGNRLIAEGDFAGGSLSYRKALMVNSTNPEIWKRIAAFLESENSPDVIPMWKRLTHLEPDVAEHKFRRVEASLKFDSLEQARQALETIPENERDSERYFMDVGELAVKRGEFEKAADQFEKALALNPESALASFKLAVAESRLADEERRASGAKRLRDLAASGKEMALEAQRELIQNAFLGQDFYDANRLAAEVIKNPASTLNDRFVHLNTEFAIKSFTLPNSIQALHAYAEKNPDYIQPAAGFLVSRGLGERTLQWLRNLPEDQRLKEGSQNALFETLLAAYEIDDALDVLKAGGMSYTIAPETLDLAEKALEGYESGLPDAGRTWQRSLYSASGDSRALWVMVKLAQAKAWRDAQAKAMWAFSAALPNKVEIWKDLLRLEQERGNASGMLRAVSGAVKADRYDLSAWQSWVMLNVLLKKGDASEVLKRAAMLHEAEPANASFAVSYALALDRAGKNEEALEVLQRLAPKDLSDPAQALYIGTVLAGSSRKEEALRYLNEAKKTEDKMITHQQLLLLDSVAVAEGRPSISELTRSIMERSEPDPAELERIKALLRTERNERADAEETDRLIESIRQLKEQRKRTPEEIEALMSAIRNTESVPND